MPETDYYVLMADVISSRKKIIQERNLLQNLIGESIGFLNQLFEPGIEKPVMFSAGDEVQGLFKDPATPFLYFRFLSMITGKQILRGSIGRGAWETRIKGGSTAQDGPAFHNARAGITYAKSDSSPFEFVYWSERLISGITNHSVSIINFRSPTQSSWALFTELLSPLIITRSSFSSNQIEYVAHARRILEAKCKLLLAANAEVSSTMPLMKAVLLPGVLQPSLIRPELTCSDTSDLDFFEIVDEDSFFETHPEILRFGTEQSIQGFESKINDARISEEREAAKCAVFALTESKNRSKPKSNRNTTFFANDNFFD